MAFAGCCELTNLFLVPIFAAKELPQIKDQMWYKINGLLLWVTFVTHRFVLFPVWLYMWYEDVKVNQFGDHHPLEEWGYSFTIASLLALSIVWFVKIHKAVAASWLPKYYPEPKKDKYN